jgi:hypothetical protein
MKKQNGEEGASLQVLGKIEYNLWNSVVFLSSDGD